MVVTAENGQFTFVGKSGKRYIVDAYVSDVVAAAVTFNPQGAAASGSPQYWRCPEDVTLIDWSIATGNTVAVGVTMTRDGAQIAGSNMRTANYLNTLTTRVTPTPSFPAGSLIGAVQF